MPSYDVFICYARQDEELARAIHASLQSRNLRVWRDNIIPPQAQFIDTIAKAIDASSVVLFIWSRHSVTSSFARKEVVYAYELGKLIIPYQIEESGLPPELAFILAGQQHVFAGNGNNLSDIERIITFLKQNSNQLTPIVPILNMKGGVGKTTLCANLFGIANEYFSKSVLLIDLDAQFNLTQLFLPRELHLKRVDKDLTIISAFEPGVPLGRSSPSASLSNIAGTGGFPVEALRLAVPLRNDLHFKRFDLVPGQFEIIKYSLPQNPDALQLAKRYFRSFIEESRSQFDLIAIDAGPSSSFVHECIFDVATHVLCPIRPDKYSELGVLSVKRLIEEVFKPEPRPELVYIINATILDGSDQPKHEPDREWLQQWNRDPQAKQRTIQQLIPPSGYLMAKPGRARAAEFVDVLAHRKSGAHAEALKNRLKVATQDLLKRLGFQDV